MTARTKPGPDDFLRQLKPENGVELYRKAYSEGLSFSGSLEREFPESEFKDGLDAFTRLLQQANIRTRNIPELGIYASRYEEMFENPATRVLIPELFARFWRSAATGKPVVQQRTPITSFDAGSPSVTNQTSYQTVARLTQQIAAAIPLSELVAITTPIDTGSYAAFYLTEDAASERMVRIAEGSEIPRTRLIGGDREIRVKKYGRALEASYESLRRQRLDRIALIIQLMAVRAETDKVGAVLDVLVNGDGNANTAATNYNLTALDTTATAGTLTLKGYLAFKMKFVSPYMITTALVQEAVALQMQLLNVGSANIPLVVIGAQSGWGGFTPINPGLSDNVRLGWTADAPALKIVGFDSRFAIERVYELGADISEVEQFILRQVRVITMTESEGYLKFDANAAKTLNVNA